MSYRLDLLPDFFPVICQNIKVSVFWYENFITFNILRVYTKINSCTTLVSELTEKKIFF